MWGPPGESYGIKVVGAIKNALFSLGVTKS